jgi:hypothetical protein
VEWAVARNAANTPRALCMNSRKFERIHRQQQTCGHGGARPEQPDWVVCIHATKRAIVQLRHL